MADQYMLDLLRMSIAQICQTIGYNAIQTTPLELLQDCLHKFLHEFCRDLRRHVEHYNRTEANLNDVCLTLGKLSINVTELLEYIFNVQPVTFVIEVPKFPFHKESNLNFLKPGSKEVLIRPVHIYEHLPPILPPDEYARESEITEISAISSIEKCSLFKIGAEDVNVSNIVEVKSDPVVTKSDPKTESDIKNKDFFKSKTITRLLDEEGRPTRELGSVMMTTGGFISPAIEGKLPDACIPDIIATLDGLDAPPPPLIISASNGCSAAKNTASVSAQAVPTSILSKIEIQDKPATTNAHSEICNPTSDNQTVQKEHVSALGGISNASPFTISAAAALRLAKKHIPMQHSTLPPPLAARILKKAKKKHTIFPFATHGKSTRSTYTGKSTDVGSSAIDLNDKAQRKRMMLQKSVKSAKSTKTDSTFTDSSGNLKNIPGFFNSGLPSSQSSGIQMEKILKKQVKQKKKLLKQMALGLNLKCSSISEQTQQEISFAETYNAGTSSTISSADQLSSFASIATSSYLGPKIGKQTNNPEINLLEGKTSKPNSTPQPFLNSTSPYKGIKPRNTDVPIFGDSLTFGDEKIRKDICDNQLAELKLSTEPDGSKLNIFKKISSKQKHIDRTLSPTGNAPSKTQIYAGNENQVINLPSGTTITPAPPTLGRHVYAPEDESLLPLIDGVAINNAVANKNQNTGSKIFGRTCIVDQQNQSIELGNKPKKRGRKPGSKNQPKAHEINLMVASAKKSKKFKMQKHIFGPTLQLPIDQGIEPLNLSHSFSLGCDARNEHVPLGIANKYLMLDPNSLQKDTKERKERKKPKVSQISPTRGHDIDATGCIEEQQQKSPTKKFGDSSFSGPTKEEVDSINRKLLKMDTVLQPAPPMKSSTIAHDPSLLAPKEMYSPTKCNVADSPVPKPRSTQQRNTVGNLSSSSCDVPLIPSVQNYPNLSPNMLSMLPMYPFPSRPGLIPTPGLFPPVLGTFPNNPSSSATNMLLQGFLPFSVLKPSGSGHLLSPGMKITDKTDNSTIKDAAVGETNYCNVASLVPDSIKLKVSSPGAVNSSLVSPKDGYLYDRDTPKTPQLIQSPTISETIRESLQLKLSSMGTPESKGSKSIPSTPGGVSLSTFDNFLRGGSGISTNSSTSNNSVGFTEMFRPISLPPGIDNQKYASIITSSLNIDGPIEVSDDSVDAPISTESSSPMKCKTSQHSYVKAPTLPAPLINQMDDLFIPIENTRPTGVRQFTMPIISNKEARKIKKNKKSNSVNPAASCSSFGTCVPGNKAGVSKLAGGADLIPLSATGLAYSSKSTPPNSLTASATSSSFEISKRDFTQKDVMGNITVIPSPSSDMHDKHKYHKKLKKIKYGKIKKKKDKKEKIRSKEKYFDKIEKQVKERDLYKQRDKEASKKIKKGKKREKQRSVRDSLSSPTMANSSNHCLISSGLDVSINLTSVLPSTASTSTAPSSSVVPKLTLKLGNCQSPTSYDDIKSKLPQKTIGSTVTAITREPSPELARISPLVTRPPKQKSSGIDSASLSNAIGGGVSSGSNNLGTLNTTELFVDSNKNNICSNTNITSSSIPPPPSSWSSGGTLTASSTLLPQQLLQSSISQHPHDEPSTSASSTDVTSSSNRPTSSVENTASLMHETNRPSSYIDEEGNRVWICPACGKVDDGSAMIGCDGCDAWYHWVCVGIYVAPKDNEDWFCRVCIAKKKGIHSIDRKRKRNKKSK